MIAIKQQQQNPVPKESSTTALGEPFCMWERIREIEDEDEEGSVDIDIMADFFRFLI